MKVISSHTGYQMIVNDCIPRLTLGYIKKNVVDKDVWSDLFTNKAEHMLRLAIRRHLDGLGGNVVSQLLSKLTITDEMIKSLRKKYRI